MRLTTREQQLLDSAANGLTDRQIGDEFSISIETVASYWRGIRLKFQSSSRTECVARYSQEKSESLIEKHEIESSELLKEIKSRTEAEARALAQKNILQAITDASLSYITGRHDLSGCFERLLVDVLNFTHSEFGFLAEVEHSEGVPALKRLATSPASTSVKGDFAVELCEFRPFGFSDELTLIKKLMAKAKPVIASQPSGLPSFLGVPVFSGNELIGVIGLFNGSGGYEADVLDDLKPVAATCANFISGSRLEEERKIMQQQIANSREVVRNLVDRIPAGIVYERPDRSVEFVNQTFIDMFGLGVKPSQLVSRVCFIEPLVKRQSLRDLHSIVEEIDLNWAAIPSGAKDTFELADGRKFERDSIVVESSGKLQGHLWCYREVTRKFHSRLGDQLESTEVMSHI